MPNQPSRSTPPVPRVPGDALVRAANAALQDPNFRDSVRQMHSEGYPLIKMVEALGLDDEMTDSIRQIVENLPADVVDGIRKATLTMLDGTDYTMPLDCTVTDTDLQQGIAVDVEVVPENNSPTIHVRPLSPSK